MRLFRAACSKIPAKQFLHGLNRDLPMKPCLTPGVMFQYVTVKSNISAGAQFGGRKPMKRFTWFSAVALVSILAVGVQTSHTQAPAAAPAAPPAGAPSWAFPTADANQPPT